MAIKQTNTTEEKSSNTKAFSNFARKVSAAIGAAALIATVGTIATAETASAATAAAPSAPTSVVAVAGSADASVSWTASTGKPTGYFVTSHRGSITGTPKWFASTATTEKMAGLANGTGYQFTVVAANAGGSGAPSGWSNYITPSTVPGIPTGITATAGGGNATVLWNVPSVAWYPITGYVVTPHVGAKALAPRTIHSIVDAATIHGLKNGTTYRFTVKAINAIGSSAGRKLTNAVKPAKDLTTFDDEFTGKAGLGPNADLAKHVWNIDGCWTSGCGNGSEAQYLPSNTYLDGKGDLVMRATDKPTGASCGKNPCEYTGAGIQTFNSKAAPTWSQQYGTFSARIKMPVGSGLWPAFWLAGSNVATAGWPACGEIDTLEADGNETSTVQQHIHFGATTNTQLGSAWELPKGESTSGWHTYSITWSPSGLVWSVDGHPTMAILASTIGASAWSSFFAHPFSIILDLTVGGTYVSAPKASSFPAKMLVDYVRVTKS